MTVLHREDRDGVAFLTLNRPDKRNALNAELFETLRREVDDIRAATETIGCIVIGAAGASFSAGADRDMLAAKATTAEWIFRAETIDAVASLPQTVVAAVRGHCYAGGMELVLACDFIVASETARFGDLHVKLGGHPGWGLSARLPRRVGEAWAKEITIAGRDVDGAEALRIGLATRCVPDADLDAEAATLATGIAAKDRVATYRLKHLMTHAREAKTVEQAIAYERSYRARVRKEGGW